MSVSYFRMRPTRQKHSAMDNPVAGVNLFNPPTQILDSCLSYCTDVFPNLDGSLEFSCDVQNCGASNYAGQTFNLGHVRACESLLIGGMEALFLVSYDTSASKYYVSRNYVDTAEVTPAIVRHDVNSLTGWPADPTFAYVFSSTLFAVETKVYGVFTMSMSKKMLWINSDTYGIINLPFTPRRIISHVNRIFAIDTSNKLWWCRAGDMWTWYGLEQDDDYIVASTNCKNGAYTLAAQPDVPRPIIITITSVAGGDTLGTLTLVGTAYDGTTITEVITLVAGTNISTKSFKTLTSATQAGWSAASTADTIKIGIAAIGTGFVQDDQGYWTLEREFVLCDLCVIGDTLYIFSNSSIYAFSGYSPDTFSLKEVISDLGLTTGIYSTFKQLCVSNNIAYFLANNHVYEFDGSSAPRIISRPVKTNGSVSNYIYGGVPELYTPIFEIVADNDKIYLYSGEVGYNCYLYFIKERSWWIESTAIASDNEFGDGGKILFVTKSNGDSFYTIASNLVSNKYDLFTYPVATGNGGASAHIVTKAYSNNPSEDETLTGLVISYKGKMGSAPTIEIQILDSDKLIPSTSWSTIKTETLACTGGIQFLRVDLFPPLIKRRPVYMLKITVKFNNVASWLTSYEPFYIYNIERIFRTIGRTR